MSIYDFFRVASQADINRLQGEITALQLTQTNQGKDLKTTMASLKDVKDKQDKLVADFGTFSTDAKAAIKDLQDLVAKLVAGQTPDQATIDALASGLDSLDSSVTDLDTSVKSADPGAQS